jgi:DNA polymerase III subunit alpha
VLPPDVNSGDTTFTVDGGKIRFGLAAVKNVGEGAVEAIIEERRANGPFTSLFNFCERVDLRKVNKRVVEGLIACGAFDSLSGNRARMTAALEEALEYGQKVQKERCDPQLSLFDDGPDCTLSLTPPALPDVPEWGQRERLMAEKEALGFYITGHPLDPHRKTMAKFSNLTSGTVEECSDGKIVRIGGMVTGRKVIRTKKDELMAFIQLEDMEGSMEVVIFPSVYAGCQLLLTDDRPIFVQGKLQKEEKGAKLLADTIVAMEEAETLWTAEVHFTIDMARTRKETLVQLRDIVRRYPGDCTGWLHLMAEGNVEAIISISDEWRIQYGEALSREVNALFGYPVVETRCGEIKAAPENGPKPRNGAGGRRN